VGIALTQTQKNQTINVGFYATSAYPCSYLNERMARSQIAASEENLGATTYDRLAQLGFRRSGLMIYRPYCDGCQACVALRVPVQHFQPNRSQKRAWRLHQDLTPRSVPLRFEAEHYALYRRYQNNRHPGGGMDEDNVEQYAEFLLQSQVNTQLVEFREPTTNDDLGALKMVSLIDILEDGVSAVYTFYEPESGTSYGTYNILWQIEQARRHQLAYVYLGYWIQEDTKMAYKAQFQPHELCINEQWQVPIKKPA
jgi:leucyl-tRNA---protein transferase